jgi:hypothetical protein
MMAHPRHANVRWGVFQKTRHRVDVAPCTASGYMSPQHTFGQGCKCHPYVDASGCGVIIIHGHRLTDSSDCNQIPRHCGGPPCH